MTQDEQYLRILSIFHYVVAGIATLFSLCPSIHLVLGIIMAGGGLRDPNDPLPTILVGWFFIVFASIWILLGLAFAVAVLAAGRNLQAKRRYMFCLVMACIQCMFMPFGTILGAFTIVILLRPSVKTRFAIASESADAEGPVGAV